MEFFQSKWSSLQQRVSKFVPKQFYKVENFQVAVPNPKLNQVPGWAFTKPQYFYWNTGNSRNVWCLIKEAMKHFLPYFLQLMPHVKIL
jgi:hypothetical protein